MSNAAIDWLDKGKLWRHPGTGHVAGPVLDETNPRMTSLFRTCAAVLIAVGYAAYLLAVVRYSYWLWQFSRMPPPLPGWPAVWIGPAAGVIAFAFWYLLKRSSPVRCVALCAGASLLLYLLHFPWITVAAMAVLTGLAGATTHNRARIANARFEAAGYRQVVAKPRMPPNYTGAWRVQDRVTQWEKGKLVGRYVSHWVTGSDGKTPEKQGFYMPYACDKYPYGWYFAGPHEGYLPRQSDPFQSPTPAPPAKGPVSNVTGENKPMDDADLSAMGALHGAGKTP